MPELDLQLKMLRLHGKTKESPRIFPMIRKTDSQPLPTCVLCDPDFFRRNSVFYKNRSFVWTTKDQNYLPGDTMITANKHFDTFNGLTESGCGDLADVINVANRTYRTIPEVAGISYLQAVGGKVAGQGVEGHFHGHMFPKFLPGVERIVTIKSEGNFSIYDASSFYLARIMGTLDPQIMALTYADQLIPGGMIVKDDATPFYEVVKRLEQTFYKTVKYVQTVLQEKTTVEEKIELLTLMSQVNLTDRRQKIFKWMLKAFSQSDLKMFGYDLFFNENQWVFLPRSGLFGAKRLGPVSIYGNMHWQVSDPGSDSKPAVYTAPYKELPIAHSAFNQYMIEQLDNNAKIFSDN